MALEARLASVKERQGSRGALESAIASYEKLYDIAGLTTRWSESVGEARDEARGSTRGTGTEGGGGKSGLTGPWGLLCYGRGEYARASTQRS